jgi:hypothetical protein
MLQQVHEATYCCNSKALRSWNLLVSDMQATDSALMLSGHSAALVLKLLINADTSNWATPLSCVNLKP